MYKKIFLFLVLILCLSGCTSKEQKHEINSIYYQLNISNYYKENITFTFPANAYELAKENVNVDYDSLEYILLIDNFSRPIHNNLYTLYGKSIMQLKNAIEVDLDFDYIESDFVHSNYMNTCFENHSIKDEEDYLEIDLSGNFYCLQDKTMNIQVQSIYPDIYTNGTQVGDSVQWTIDSSNMNNVSIYYKVMRNKRNMATSYGSIAAQNSNPERLAIIEFFIIVAVLVGGFIFYKNLYKFQKKKR